jgi:hypothetical protein
MNVKVESSRHAFSWQLPAGWEFVHEIDRAALYLPQQSAVEVFVARRIAQPAVRAVLMANDVVEIVAGNDPAVDRHDQEYARRKLQMAGAKNIRVSFQAVGGLRAARASATIPGLPDPNRSVTAFYAGRRRFEVDCLAALGEPTDTDPCAPALAGLTVQAARDPQAVRETPRHLRLAGEKFGIVYDPPDETWAAIGPRTGYGGAQMIWVWNDGSHQIDVQGFDVSVFAAYPDAAAVAATMAEHYRTERAAVTIGAETANGIDWTHLDIAKPNGQHQDVFIHRTGNMLYTVLVTESDPDPALARRALAGFKLRAQR